MEKHMSFIEIEYRETNKEWNMADLQAHNFYEIYYLLKGERDIFIEDKIFTLHENSIVIIPPFYMHKTEGGPYQRINVYLSEDLFYAIFHLALNHRHPNQMKHLQHEYVLSMLFRRLNLHYHT